MRDAAERTAVHAAGADLFGCGAYPSAGKSYSDRWAGQLFVLRSAREVRDRNQRAGHYHETTTERDSSKRSGFADVQQPKFHRRDQRLFADVDWQLDRERQHERGGEPGERNSYALKSGKRAGSGEQRYGESIYEVRRQAAVLQG